MSHLVGWRYSCRARPYRYASWSLSARQKSTWGFIGLGNMGYPMAKNLEKKIPKDSSLIIYDVDPKASARFTLENAKTSQKSTVTTTAAASIQEVVQESDVIITVLPNTVHVQNVFRDITAATAPKTTKEKLFLDCSTIDPAESQKIAESVLSSGIGKFVDAPMSGGTVGATAGTLAFMVGCDKKELDSVNTTLNTMGRKVIHCGQQGSGLIAKLANNYILGIANVATAEALNFGAQWGLDPVFLSHLINSSTGQTWISVNNNHVPGFDASSPANRDYAGGFNVGLMKKDMALAYEAARRIETPLHLADSALKLYDTVANDEEHGKRDLSVVYRYMNQGRSGTSKP